MARVLPLIKTVARRWCGEREGHRGGGAAHHDAAGGLQAQAERRDVQQQQVLHLVAALAAQDGRLRATSN
jgi:hypothetical protein